MPLALSRLFTDHLVLQRGRLVPVWGTAEPGERVQVEVAGVRAEAAAGADGRFRAMLPALGPGGPHDLRVRGERSGEVVVRDVLVGEVWLCSGQSNMEWPVSVSGYTQAQIAGIKHERIRLFKVPNSPASKPRAELGGGTWMRCEPAAAESFSGVAYAFGVELERAVGVPVGLIQSAWGGTAAEWWTPIAALEADPELAPIVQRMRDQGPLPEPGTPEHAAALAKWEAEAFYQDPGNQGEGMGWAKPDADLGDWQPMRLPQHWEATGLNIDGAVWFRRTVTVPAAWAGRDLTLSLGPIDDFDVTYVDGERVGATGKEVRDSYNVPRIYTVPGRLVRGGTLTIAVRVFDHLGNGGIWGHPTALAIHPVGKPDEGIALAGEWLYRVELALPPKAWTPPPATADAHSLPARLWNGMINPLVPYALRGAIWYQGESNADRSEQYRGLMKTMIGQWRRAWGWDFPFYQVELAPFMARRDEPSESGWAELRESQMRVARELTACDLASLIDSGDAADIHPKNKALAGRRLARLALARDYSSAIEPSGPRFVGMETADGALRLRFSHCHGGLAAHGGIVRGFAIAGDDRAFRWAEATVDGDCVLVRSADVAKPVAARYAWADNPLGTLMNQDGLPAHPFRTDSWPGVTTGKR
jgi:sialate O-acetylesterase